MQKSQKWAVRAKRPPNHLMGRSDLSVHTKFKLIRPQPHRPKDNSSLNLITIKWGFATPGGQSPTRQVGNAPLVRWAKPHSSGGQTPRHITIKQVMSSLEKHHNKAYECVKSLYLLCLIAT